MKDENFTFVNDNPRIYDRSNIVQLNYIEDGAEFQNRKRGICQETNNFCLGNKILLIPLTVLVFILTEFQFQSCLLSYF